MAEENKKKRFLRRLKSKYRLVIMNDETLEEKASFNLRPLNLFVGVGIFIIILITITTFIIAFTGLREYIPGYADVNTRRQVTALALKADSMDRALKARDLYMNNIRNIIDGNIVLGDTTKVVPAAAKFDTIRKLNKSAEDAELRKLIESEDQYNLTAGSSRKDGITASFFFPPLKGVITNRFNQNEKHYGIDIVANANDGIKATLDGTVIISNFTSETGYVIGIQHSNNLFSFYKHNSALLKKAGDYVKAGEVIAIIGNSGELSSGPHLHFELWFNGNPINPSQYISF